MSRLALFNLMFGFWLLFLAAAAGAFIATDLSRAYLQDRAFVDSWLMMLTKSAHGHANLFALTHIAFGLTLPYSPFSSKLKTAQTVGLAMGSLGMGPVMLVRAYLGPKEGLDPTHLALGIMLSAALAAIFTHAAGLTAKFLRRS